ncbi:hypothetical protein LFZ56_08460 [Salmonella bongori serovar 66:z41:- str. SA19983605]|uniref:Uncharacterized protein n=1 Tax=Salmonella bongori serovar 66:z41:- str. SA19983605 TaxID=1243617 RepID=A0A248K7P5_SALBN|nr:hypothetical protein LFZ56_08460 [Salmonella bongori serovar 66:z41:- str. SA19983605]
MTSVAVTCEPVFAEVFTGRGCHPEFLRRFFQAMKHGRCQRQHCAIRSLHPVDGREKGKLFFAKKEFPVDFFEIL